MLNYIYGSDMKQYDDETTTSSTTNTNNNKKYMYGSSGKQQKKHKTRPKKIINVWNKRRKTKLYLSDNFFYVNECEMHRRQNNAFIDSGFFHLFSFIGLLLYWYQSNDVWCLPVLSYIFSKYGINGFLFLWNMLLMCCRYD